MFSRARSSAIALPAVRLVKAVWASSTSSEGAGIGGSCLVVEKVSCSNAGVVGTARVS